MTTRVEAPAFVIDLDDVARLDALEPHVDRNSSRNRRNRAGLPAGGSIRGPRDAPAGGQALGLLAVRWLVDGMNVIGTRPDAWWKDRHAAMVRLVDLLERLGRRDAART